MYCATDDEEAIEMGLTKIKRILSENYVRPDQSEYVKSKIKENGQYTVIDKITVTFDDREDKYVARFINLRMDPFEVPSDLVVHNEKLLIGGIWCIVKIEYVGLNKEEDDEQAFEEDIFGNQKKKKKIKKKKSRYESPFEIASLKPIQMPKMDHYYRQFHTAFGKSLKESNTVLEDLYKSVAEYVENLYKNWYLAKLGTQWTTLVADELTKGAALKGIPQQVDFYKNYVKPIAASGSRAYVIISDALRYEVAVELTGQLIRETKGSAKISAMQATFPSATKFGMAALLPHSQLQLTDDGKVLCDGNSTEGTAAREKILATQHPQNVAIAYKALLAMTKEERQKAVANAQVVYGKR